MNVLQFQISIAYTSQIDNPHSYHFRFGAHNTQHSVAHNISTRIDTQNNLFLDWYYHSTSSINVGNPTTLSLNMRSISSLSFTPCSRCQR